MNIGIYQEPTFLITNLNSHNYLFLRRMSSPVYSGLPFPASCRDVRQSRDKGGVPPESTFEKKGFISRERFLSPTLRGWWGTNCGGACGGWLLFETAYSVSVLWLQLARLPGLLSTHKEDVVRGHFEKKAKHSRDGF